MFRKYNKIFNYGFQILILKNTNKIFYNHYYTLEQKLNYLNELELKWNFKRFNYELIPNHYYFTKLNKYESNLESFLNSVSDEEEDEFPDKEDEIVYARKKLLPENIIDLLNSSLKTTKHQKALKKIPFKDIIKAIKLNHKNPLKKVVFIRLFSLADSINDLNLSFKVLKNDFSLRLDQDDERTYRANLGNIIYDQLFNFGGYLVFERFKDFLELRIVIDRRKWSKLFKYCSQKCPERVKELWDFLVDYLDERDLTREAVFTMRCYLENNMFEEAKKYLNALKIRGYKVNLNGNIWDAYERHIDLKISYNKNLKLFGVCNKQLI